MKKSITKMGTSASTCSADSEATYSASSEAIQYNSMNRERCCALKTKKAPVSYTSQRKSRSNELTWKLTLTDQTFGPTHVNKDISMSVVIFPCITYIKIRKASLNLAF